MTREELLAAARQFDESSLPDHAGSCKECGDILRLLARFYVAGNLPLSEPPKAWVDRTIALAGNPGLVKQARSVLASLVFDSWAQPQPVGVRGGEATEQRRMRFECNDIAIDLRAEQQNTGWSFVAQIIGAVPEAASLYADSQAILPDSHGMCQWSSQKPPRKLILETETATIAIPEVVWKRKRPKN